MNLEGNVTRTNRNFGDGAPFTLPGLRGGELAVSDTHAKFQELALRGDSYILSLAAGAATAYVGAAGGTPLLALHNPANSGRVLVLIAIAFANRVAASGAGTATFNLWGGPSVLPTGTVIAPRNILSMAQSGSVAVGFANAALTGSTALNLLMPIGNYYWATAAGAISAAQYVEINGLIAVAPGNQIAFGATAALTSATWDAALIYEEIVSTL